jgi:hypothetical protein
MKEKTKERLLELQYIFIVCVILLFISIGIIEVDLNDVNKFEEDKVEEIEQVKKDLQCCKDDNEIYIKLLNDCYDLKECVDNK